MKPCLPDFVISGYRQDEKTNNNSARFLWSVLTAGFWRLSNGSSQQQAEAGQHTDEVHVEKLWERFASTLVARNSIRPPYIPARARPHPRHVARPHSPAPVSSSRTALLC